MTSSVTILDTTFAINSQWGQPGINVFALDDQMNLTLTTAVPDTADSHVGDVTDIETLTIADRTFALSVSGADAGVTSHRVGHTGAMRLMDALGPGDGLWVSAPAALAAADPAITPMLIAGLGGDDTLSGGGGAGQDSLSGGAGADDFVFIADGETDRVTDFEDGLDRIDLSDLPMLYGVGQLTLAQQGDAVRVTTGSETLLVSADGGLQVADLTSEDFVFRV